MTKYFFVIISLLFMTSCSYFYGSRGIVKTRDEAYLQAESIPLMKQPVGMAPIATQDHYPVSDKNYPTRKNKISLVPPGLK